LKPNKLFRLKFVTNGPADNIPSLCIVNLFGKSTKFPSNELKSLTWRNYMGFNCSYYNW